MNPGACSLKDKQNRQALKQAHEEKKREDPNKHSQKWKRRGHNGYHQNQRIVRNYYEELYAKKFENLGEVDTFLKNYNLPKLNEEEAEILNRPITAKEIEAVIKKLPSHKSPGPDGFTGDFYKAFKEELTPILHRLFEKLQTDGRLPNSF